MAMVQRERHLRRLRELLADHPAVAILGARQVAKTTIAREIAASFPGNSLIFDLEDPGDLARLSEPILAEYPPKPTVAAGLDRGLRVLPVRVLVSLEEFQHSGSLFKVSQALLS